MAILWSEGTLQGPELSPEGAPEQATLQQDRTNKSFSKTQEDKEA